MIEQWLTAIGTMVLAIVALFQDFIRTWLKTPQLTLQTGSFYPFSRKLLFKNKENPSETADGYALRVEIKNNKPKCRLNARAEKVEVFALRLLKRDKDGSFKPVHEFEPRNLIWSHSFLPLADISPSMQRFCFIGRMLKPYERKKFAEFDLEDVPIGETCLCIDVDIPRNTKDHILRAGTYRLECLIGASNTEAFHKTFEICISGEWFDDEVKMFEKGLTIKEIN